MTRTLHVIDQPGELAQPAVLRLSFDAAQIDQAQRGCEHAWLLFGGQAMRDAARAVGLGDHQFRLFPKPSGLQKMLPASLTKPRQLISQAHRILCWTEGACQIASLLGCANVVRRVNDASPCPFAQDIIAQATQRTTCLSHVERQGLRERWGVDTQAKVIALIGDRFDEIDMRVVMLAMGFTYESLRAAQQDAASVRLLCHPLTKRRVEASYFNELVNLEQLLIQDATVAMPWSVLPGCDLALVPWPGAAGLSMLWAEAMGLPILAPRDAQIPLLARLKQTFPARSNKPKDLADALTHWAKQ